MLETLVCPPVTLISSESCITIILVPLNSISSGVKSISVLCSHRFPIVEPDPGHTKLRLSKEGLEAIERITTPIAAVAVSLRCKFLSTCNFFYFFIF